MALRKIRRNFFVDIFIKGLKIKTTKIRKNDKKKLFWGAGRGKQHGCVPSSGGALQGSFQVQTANIKLDTLRNCPQGPLVGISFAKLLIAHIE